jgi:hypothetical protein
MVGHVRSCWPGTAFMAGRACLNVLQSPVPEDDGQVQPTDGEGGRDIHGRVHRHHAFTRSRAGARPTDEDAAGVGRGVERDL